jgi:hypothetical protein
MPQVIGLDTGAAPNGPHSGPYGATGHYRVRYADPRLHLVPRLRGGMQPLRLRRPEYAREPSAAFPWNLRSRRPGRMPGP